MGGGRFSRGAMWSPAVFFEQKGFVCLFVCVCVCALVLVLVLVLAMANELLWCIVRIRLYDTSLVWSSLPRVCLLYPFNSDGGRVPYTTIIDDNSSTETWLGLFSQLGVSRNKSCPENLVLSLILATSTSTSTSTRASGLSSAQPSSALSLGTGFWNVFRRGG